MFFVPERRCRTWRDLLRLHQGLEIFPKRSIPHPPTLKSSFTLYSNLPAMSIHPSRAEARVVEPHHRGQAGRVPKNPIPEEPLPRWSPKASRLAACLCPEALTGGRFFIEGPKVLACPVRRRGRRSDRFGWAGRPEARERYEAFRVRRFRTCRATGSAAGETKESAKGLLNATLRSPTLAFSARTGSEEPALPCTPRKRRISEAEAKQIR